MFSQTCKYAIRTLLYIAKFSHEGKYVGIKQVVNDLHLPHAFIAKILQDLSRKKLVESAKGPHGGFLLNAQQQGKTLLDVVLAIDGDDIINACCLGLGECHSNQPCILHHSCQTIRNQIKQMLQATRLQDVHLQSDTSQIYQVFNHNSITVNT